LLEELLSTAEWATELASIDVFSGWRLYVVILEMGVVLACWQTCPDAAVFCSSAKENCRLDRPNLNLAF